MNTTALRQRLLDAGLADNTSIRGCSMSELMQIEAVAQRPLPAAYMEFMRNFGVSAGRFMRDDDVFFPAVLDLKRQAIQILQHREDLELTLPATAHVFAVSRKEQFLFFSDLSDDPPVLHYMSGDSAFSPVSGSFSQFIADELDQCEYYYRQVKGTPTTCGRNVSSVVNYIGGGKGDILLF